MAKIRHIAYRAEDVEAMAAFFVNAFEMQIAQRRERGAIDLTDGTLNITLLPASGPRADGKNTIGIDHMGFTVEDLDASRTRLEAAGARELNPINLGQAHFEMKFQGPEGIVVDIGHWVGTAPIDAGEPVGAHAAK